MSEMQDKKKKLTIEEVFIQKEVEEDEHKDKPNR